MGDGQAAGLTGERNSQVLGYLENKPVSTRAAKSALREVGTLGRGMRDRESRRIRWVMGAAD